MKIHTPFYLAFAFVLAVFVALANHQGWSLLQSVASQTWQHSAPGTQHK